MRELTIVLPLKDKSEYTEIWLNSNLSDKYNYIIADGSQDNSNEKIVNKFNLENLIYIKFSPDLKIRDFLHKLYISMSKVKTKYVMLADNDDFLVFKGIDKCLDRIKKDKTAITVQGKIGLVRKINQLRYKRISYDYVRNLYRSEKCFENFQLCTRIYAPLWYSIYKSNYQLNLFKQIFDSGITNPYLAEEFHTYITLAQGNILYEPSYYYVRLLERSGSTHKYLYPKYKYDCILNPDYYSSYNKLVNVVSSQLSIDFKIIDNLIRLRRLDQISSGDQRFFAIFIKILVYKLKSIINNFRPSSSAELKSIQSLFS